MRKKWFHAAALGMAAAMLMTGCGQNSASPESGAAGETEEVAADVEEGADSILFDGEDTELNVVFPGSNAAPADLQKVEDGINEILAQHMDAHVKLQIIEWGAYGDQCNLMLSSGEDLDLLWTTRTSQYGPKGQLMDVQTLLPVYAPGALDSVKTYVDACYINGELYGLPTFHDISKASGICVRKDIVDELGINMDELNTWDDVDAMLAEVKEAYPDMNVLVPGTVGDGVLAGIKTSLYDELENIGVGVTYASSEPKVENLYASEEYRELCMRAHDWNQKGYFLKDAATNTETRQNYISAGNTFGYIVGTIYPGFASQETNSCGTEIIAKEIGEAQLTTSAAKASQWVIPTACEAPEKTLTFMELLYTDPDVQNLFFYGVEGVDYVITDEEAGQISYPEGVDSTTVGWSNEAWITGNGSIAYTWATDDADLWDQLVKFNESGRKSAIYGFVYDNSNISNEITALSNVISKYKSILESGAVDDVEGTLAKFNEELEAAGIQKVIDDMQAQVDAWAAAE